jgi:hypothetical protein
MAPPEISEPIQRAPARNMAPASERNTWFTRKLAQTSSISATDWCQRTTFPARMLAATAPADVPTMMGNGHSGRLWICDNALRTPTW